jgi:hypothetical protein
MVVKLQTDPFSKLHSQSVSRSVNKCEFKSENEVKKKKRYHFRNAHFFLVVGTRTVRGQSSSNVRPSADGYEPEQLNLFSNKNSTSAGFELLFTLQCS